MNEQQGFDDDRTRRFTRRFVVGFAVVEATLLGIAVFSRYFHGSLQ